MAFITGAPTLRTSTFTNTSIKTKSTCATSSSTRSLTMSTGSVSRREALLAGSVLLASTIIPKSAFAKSGDSPKISVFGVGGASSPFDAGIQRGGDVIYKTFNDDEITIYKRIVSESKDRLIGASDSIKNKSWEDIRSRIRLEASDLRKTQLTVNANIDDKKQSEAAKKAYLAFKTDIENLDQACVAKDQDKAYKAYNASVKSLGNWESTVGF